MRKEILIPLLAVLLAAKFAIDHVGDVDLFWHLRLGLDLLASQGSMRSHVPYTWTYDGDWPAFDWLAQVLIALAYGPGGYLSLAIFKALLAAALTMCLYRAALSRAGGNVRAAGAALFLSIFIAAANFSSRPLFLAHVLLAMELLVLEEARAGRHRALWLLPPLFVLWGNLHGSWPFGLGPIAVFAAECWLPLRLRFWRPTALDDLGIAADLAATPTGNDRRSRLRGWVTARAFRAARPRLALLGLATLSGCVLAQLVTPDPIRFLTRPFQWVGKNTEIWMTEWAAVPIEHPAFWLLLFTGGLIAFAILRSRRPLPLFEILFVALSFALALAKFRLIAYFAIACAPLLSGLLAARVSPEGFRNRKVNAALAALGVLLLGGVSLFNLSRVDDAVEDIAPKEAVDVLLASGRAESRGFNYFDWGGYLVLRQIPTFIDGRLEPFAASGVLDDYMRIEHEADLGALEARGIDWILTRGDLPLARALAASRGWALAHRSMDGTGAELWLREVAR